MESFRQEVRMVARLDHPSILGVKDASIIDGHFVIVTLMGDEALDERLTRRLSLKTALAWSGQLLDAVAYAHQRKIVHCDIKPENVLVFSDGQIRLTDFGIAKISHRTIVANGTGTVGYMAPEQAMGRPSARSDVFSLGLLIYRMMSGVWPEWPFDWPPAGAAKLRARGVHPDLLKFLRRSMQVRASSRFRDAGVMSREFKLLQPRVLRNLNKKRKANAKT
jgi:serine/threonine-protein kinase